MQVACDHCGAEYDLDGSEIIGRGVRITCPSCSHVFVVYQTEKEESFELEVDLELDDNGELSMDLDGMLESLIADVEESADVVQQNNAEEDVEGIAEKVKESTENSFASESSQTSDVYVQPTLQAGSEDPQETESAVQASISSEQIASLDVHSLNFAGVGIKSWKVKKPIGLMFEYSDYKTFQKSLNDGRISSGDQISPDGKSWTPMSDIEDFEVFFCKTYLEFEQSEGVVKVKQVKEKVIPSLGGTNELASALAAAQAEVEQANRPQPTRKSSQKRPARKPQKARAPEPTKSSSGLLVNVVIGLAVVVGGWMLFGGEDAPPSVPAQNTQVKKTVDEAPSLGEEDASLKELREELQRNAAKLEEQNEPEPEPSAEDEPQLIAKVPDEILAQQRALQEGKDAAAPVQKTVNHALEGQNALNAQQWAKAVESFNKAYQTDQNPEHLASVGYAQFKSGELTQAKKSLLSAVKKGSTSANKWLGYVMRDEGDVAGSNQYFNQYLQSNPRDAALIRQEMMQ